MRKHFSGMPETVEILSIVDLDQDRAQAAIDAGHGILIILPGGSIVAIEGDPRRYRPWKDFRGTRHHLLSLALFECRNLL